LTNKLFLVKLQDFLIASFKKTGTFGGVKWGLTSLPYPISKINNVVDNVENLTLSKDVENFVNSIERDSGGSDVLDQYPLLSSSMTVVDKPAHVDDEVVVAGGDASDLNSDNS